MVLELFWYVLNLRSPSDISKYVSCLCRKYKTLDTIHDLYIFVYSEVSRIKHMYWRQLTHILFDIFHTIKRRYNHIFHGLS